MGESVSGSNSPVVYSLQWSKDKYVVCSVEEPLDGSAYEESLKKMFPEKILRRLNSVIGFFSSRNKEYLNQKL